MSWRGLSWRKGVWPIAQKVLLQESHGWVMEVITTLVYPLTFLLAFGLGLKGTIEQVNGQPYALFLMPGLIGYTLLLEAFSVSSWGLWLDRWHLGMLDEARIKPVSASSLILGQIFGVGLVAFAKGLITALVLCAVLGYWPGSVWNVLLFIAHVMPGVLLFVCLGSTVGLLFKKPDHISQSLTILVTPMLYLGGLFFPIAGLPDWLQKIVVWFPTAVFFEGGRAALLTGQWEWSNLVWVWGLGLLAFWGCVSFFNWRLSR